MHRLRDRQRDGQTFGSYELQEHLPIKKSQLVRKLGTEHAAQLSKQDQLEHVYKDREVGLQHTSPATTYKAAKLKCS